MEDRNTADTRRTSEKADEPASAFESIITRIFEAAERVCRSASNLEEVGNRVMGALPEQAGDGSKGNVESPPDGTLDHAYRALNRLDASLARLEAAALRIDRI